MPLTSKPDLPTQPQPRVHSSPPQQPRVQPQLRPRPPSTAAPDPSLRVCMFLCPKNPNPFDCSGSALPCTISCWISIAYQTFHDICCALYCILLVSKDKSLLPALSLCCNLRLHVLYIYDTCYIYTHYICEYTCMQLFKRICLEIHMILITCFFTFWGLQLRDGNGLSFCEYELCN